MARAMHGRRSYAPLVLSVLLLALAVATATAAANTTTDLVQDVLNAHMSTKTKYPEPTDAEYSAMRAREDAVAAALQCRPVQLNMVVRHGTRYPTTKDIRRISRTHAKLLDIHEQQRDQDVRDTPTAWIYNWTNPYNDEHAGWLAPIGVDELVALGVRLRQRFGTSFPRHVTNASTYTFDSTWKPRAQQSASAFAYGFFEQHFEPVHVHVAPIGTDHALRFFDNCPAYDRAIDLNASATMHYAQYRHSAQMQRNLQSFQRLSGDSASNPSLTLADMEAAYAACAFDVAVHDVASEWCALFTAEALLSLDYFHDLKHYYKKSHGHALAFEIAAPLLQDVATTMRARVRSRNTAAVGHFRFAHAETILPLAALLDLSHFDKTASDSGGHLLATTPIDVALARSFHGAELAPFAANIGFVLYECDGGSADADASSTNNKTATTTFRVATLLHERPVALRECNNEELCPFTQFEQIYKRWLDEYDFYAQCV